jgi:zinc protease
MTTGLGRGLAPERALLDTGAAVIVQETTTAPAVTIDASFRAGSVYESPDLPGLAHFVARVLDRGTERRTADRLAEELDDRGVSLLVATTRHTLRISCTCLAEDFDEMLSLVVDVARRPTFPDEEIAKRRAETTTAIRQDEDNPAVRAVESVIELMYGAGHPYACRAKGTPESLERITRDAMVTYHRHHLVPASLSLVVVGDVRAPRVVERAAEELAGWNGSRPEPVPIPSPEPITSRRRKVIAMPGKPQTDIAYGFTTIRRLDPRYYAYWMMNNILGQFGLGGRLAENIRERQGMAYYAFSSCDPNVGEGPLLVRAGVDPANVERAVEAIDKEVRDLGTDGPTPTEVVETREYLIGSIPRLFETNQSIAAFLQNCDMFGLGLDYDQRLPSLLAAVTRDEIAAAAAEVLRPERASLAIAGPHEAEGPALSERSESNG